MDKPDGVVQERVGSGSFLKKNQKTFTSLGWAHARKTEAKQSKVFWFFFLKKNILAFFSLFWLLCARQAGRRAMEFVTVSVLPDTGDDRGSSFPLNGEVTAFLGEARGCHCATILPAMVRGNHYHGRQKEVLFIAKGSAWTLHWDEGAGTAVNRHDFTGADAIVVKIRPGASHAVENRGAMPLFMVGLADQAYDPARPDAFRRDVTATPEQSGTVP